jgi:hypothetical protein
LAMVALFLTGACGAAALSKSEELFTLTNVWAVHLTFTLQQWRALEPKRNGTERIPSGPAPNWLGREGGPTDCPRRAVSNSST